MQKSDRTSCVQKNYIWDSATCICENGKYLESIIDDYAWQSHRRYRLVYKQMCQQMLWVLCQQMLWVLHQIFIRKKWDIK